MKILQTKVAESGHLETGPTDGHPVVMLPGFPDDALAREAVVACLDYCARDYLASALARSPSPLAVPLGMRR